MAAKTTQRAYTLRIDSSEPSWRDALWDTHSAINQGVKVFGDWLLTLRGGLHHSLANAEWPARGKRPAKAPTPEEQRDRRILLALSWLSVEDAQGAPQGEGIRLAAGSDSVDDRRESLLSALAAILEAQGVGADEVQQWQQDCGPSLSACIRADAVWVNRYAIFRRKFGPKGLADDEIWDLLGKFFEGPESYFAGLDESASEDPSESAEEDDGGTTDEPPRGAPDVEKAKDLVQKAGQWLSSRFGKGQGADFASMAANYARISRWAAEAAEENTELTGQRVIEALSADLGLPADGSDLKSILRLVSGPGHKSATRNRLKRLSQQRSVCADDLRALSASAEGDAEKCRGNVDVKGQRDWANKILKEVEQACGFTYLQGDGPSRHAHFAVMLDHAARRVVVAHSWIKRAEAERRKLQQDADLMARVPEDARRWLEDYVQRRGEESGALGDYRIRRRAIGGWAELVKKWGRDACRSLEDRRRAIKDLQQDDSIKFGDARLFEDLASEEARCVWIVDGQPTAEILDHFVRATEARFKQRRFKVPAYRHPHELRNPVWLDYGKSRLDIAYNWPSRRHGGGRTLKMEVWTDHRWKPSDFRWHSKRLFHDFAGAAVDAETARDVARADRLGRAAAGGRPGEPVFARAVFGERNWPGRLQCPRSQLEAIADRLDRNNGEWDDRALRQRRRLKWFLTYSAKLQPAGPWIQYREKCGLTGEKGFHSDANRKRGKRVKLLLSRLPGLRVLSVDLGHRYAAACAVWQVVTDDDVAKLAKQLRVEPPSPADVYWRPSASQSASQSGRGPVFRRIGPSVLATGEEHPGPWARLDRQFMVKLQGEDRPARIATDEELSRVEALAAAFGDSFSPPRALRVDELMYQAVRIARLGIRHHGDLAKVAWGLVTDETLLPGGRSHKVVEFDQLVELRQAALTMWWKAAQTRRGALRDLWEHSFAGCAGLGLPDISEHPPLKASDPAFEDLLQKTAASLERDEASRRRLACELAARHEADDAAIRRELRWLRDWILPRAKVAARKGHAIRDVGGLSLTRIATMKALYQVMKAFHQRPLPADPRAHVPEAGDDAMEDFGLSILEAIERLRDNRVKQLVSRLVEAALGLGREPGSVGGRQRPRMDDAPDDPRFAPCHAIVVENLRHYMPEEMRTRRENRQLMSWSAGQVRARLEAACELHGLYFVEVMPHYTSRQCSRTGQPGIRCADIPVDAFVADGTALQQRIKEALAIVEAGGDDAESILLARLWKRWDAHTRVWRDRSGRRWHLDPVSGRWQSLDGAPGAAPPPVRIPQRGGELFVAVGSDRWAPGQAMQADLNAAANIGLRALLDPDWPGRWWYVPCSSDGTISAADYKGGECFRDLPALPVQGPDVGAGEPKKKGRSKKSDGETIVNWWSDISSQPLNHGDRRWMNHSAYWNRVQARICDRLACWQDPPES